MKNKARIEVRRKAPRLCDCIRFPRWKTKYYIKMYGANFWFKGYDPVKDEPIYSNSRYGFFYESDAKMMYIYASKILKERVYLEKITFPLKRR